MKRRSRRRVYFQKEKAEIDEDYEYNTGRIIAEYFKDTERSGSGVSENLAQTEHYLAVPCALCKNHGPFTWGKTPHEAVYHAVVLEEVAKMAARTEAINAKAAEVPQILQDKHYLRKHGKNAYYGQTKKTVDTAAFERKTRTGNTRQGTLMECTQVFLNCSLNYILGCLGLYFYLGNL